MRTWSNPYYLKVFGDFWKYLEEQRFLNNFKPFSLVTFDTSSLFLNVTEFTGCNNYSSASNFDWHQYDFSC